MNTCINTKSIEFQNAAKRSGLSDFEFAVNINIHQSKQRKYGMSENELTFPQLDQIIGADSTQYLIEHIKLKNNCANISDLLYYTNKDNIEDAIIELNNIHRDLEINVLPLNEQCFIQINKRPTSYYNKQSNKFDVSSDIRALFPIFNKLATIYGIKFNNITTQELITNEKFKNVLDAKHTNGFILDGEIYINSDIADIDTPIHEMAHLLLGGIKYQNFKLYDDLISLSEKLPNYSDLIKLYPGRTRSDVNEEIFVTELAKFAANKPSLLQNLPMYVQDELLYNMTRLLDSILMGDLSSNIISCENRFNKSLPEIAEIVNSNIFENISRATLTQSNIHRILNNKKSDLLKNNELIEECQ